MRDDTIIEKARQEDWHFIKEKLHNYILDAADAAWPQFFVARYNTKAVAFGRIIDHGEYLEIASLGVDYYHRKKGLGVEMLSFLVEEAKRRHPGKPIYGVTHRPGFAEKVGFKEIPKGPEEIEYKKYNKCKLDPSKIKVMKLTFSRRDG